MRKFIGRCALLALYAVGVLASIGNSMNAFAHGEPLYGRGDLFVAFVLAGMCGVQSVKLGGE